MTSRRIHDPIEQRNREGRACLEQGDLEGALEKFSGALALLPPDADPLDRAGLFNNTGLVQIRLRRFEDASLSFLAAARGYREQGDLLAAARQMGNAGSACRDMEAYEAALQNYHEALALFSGQNSLMGIADQTGNIGYIHAMKNDPGRAVEWFEKALTIYRKEGEERKAELTRRNIEALRSAAPEKG
jgi:tetratricopeptide (TPR) repeat protein